jgi:hypothetical protein
MHSLQPQPAAAFSLKVSCLSRSSSLLLARMHNTAWLLIQAVIKYSRMDEASPGQQNL